MKERTIALLEDEKVRYASPLTRVELESWSKIRYWKYEHDLLEKPRQQTFAEAVKLAAYALKREESQFREPIIDLLMKPSILTGNTLTLWTPKGLYVVDNPQTELVEEVIKNPYQTKGDAFLEEVESELNKKLYKSAGNLVKKSREGHIRFVEHKNITYGRQKDTNPGLVAIVGDEITAREVIEASKVYREGLDFNGVGNDSGFTVRIPGLFGPRFIDSLKLDCALGNEHTIGPKLSSFAVSEIRN